MTQQNRVQYRLAEYTALMAKLERAAKDLHVAEVTFGVGIALFYAWVIKDGSSVAAMGRWVLLIPVFMAGIATARITARFCYIAAIEEYAREIEIEMFGNQAPLGWERRYEVRNKGYYKMLRIGTWVLATGFAILLFFFLPLKQGDSIAFFTLLPAALQ